MGTEQTVQARETGAVLNSFLATLSRTNCAVFLSRYYYADTIKKISAKYQLPERRVKYLLTRMRAQLRKCLDEEDITP